MTGTMLSSGIVRRKDLHRSGTSRCFEESRNWRAMSRAELEFSLQVTDVCPFVTKLHLWGLAAEMDK